jgi:hypothetical protein
MLVSALTQAPAAASLPIRIMLILSTIVSSSGLHDKERLLFTTMGRLSRCVPLGEGVDAVEIEQVVPARPAEVGKGHVEACRRAGGESRDEGEDP